MIYGSAGIGLFLVTMAMELKDPTLYDLAAAAGKRLLELGIPVKKGLKRRMNPYFSRLMPNFSHGTAGVAYFLATLYKETKKKEFLDGALAGAAVLPGLPSFSWICTGSLTIKSISLFRKK